MILMALLKYEEQGRQVSFRIDECRVTKNDVRYGLFDKIESNPLKSKNFNWFSNLFNSVKKTFSGLSD